MKKICFLHIILIVSIIYLSLSLTNNKRKKSHDLLGSFHQCNIIFDYDYFENKTEQKYNFNKLKKSTNVITNIFHELIYLNKTKNSYSLSFFEKCDNKIKKNVTLIKKQTKSDFYFLVLIDEKKDSNKLNINQCSLNTGILFINILFFKNKLKYYKENDLEKYLLILITKFLGFNSEFLTKQNIMNNFKITPYYFSQHLNSRYSFLKLYNLTFNKKFDERITTYKVRHESHYCNKWNIKTNDFMNAGNTFNWAITELTTNLLTDLPYNYHINECELILFNNKCYKINNKCINITDFNNNYFLEYNYDKKTKKLICYLNNKNNIKNKKCGINYGNVLSYKEMIKSFSLQLNNNKHSKYETNNSHIVPETNLFENQTLYLLQRNKFCPKIYPRTIIFINRNKTAENYLNQEKFKNYTIDKVTITNKKYFVTICRKYIVQTIHEAFNNNNIIFSIYPTDDYNFYYDSFWGRMSLNDRPTFPKYLKKRAFPILLCKKKKTYKLFLKMKKYFPNDYNFMLESYCYPEEKDLIKTKFSNYTFDKNNLWIIKLDGEFAGR